MWGGAMHNDVFCMCVHIEKPHTTKTLTWHKRFDASAPLYMNELFVLASYVVLVSCAAVKRFIDRIQDDMAPNERHVWMSFWQQCSYYAITPSESSLAAVFLRKLCDEWWYCRFFSLNTFDYNHPDRSFLNYVHYTRTFHKIWSEIRQMPYDTI